MNPEVFRGRINYNIHPDIALIAVEPKEAKELIAECGWMESIKESRAGIENFPEHIGVIMRCRNVYALMAIKHLKRNFRVRLVLAVRRPGALEADQVIREIIDGMLAHYQAGQ